MARDLARPPGPYGDVTGPLAESLRYSEGIRGPSATAEWIVEDIQAPPEFVLPIAVRANKIPRVGESYKFMPGLNVSNVTAKLSPSSNTTAIVTVEWSFPDSDGGVDVIEPGEDASEAQIEVVSTLQPGITGHDASGNPLIVSQDFEFDLGDGTNATQTITEWKRVAFQQPLHVIRFVRLERTSPGLIAPTYIGHTNDVGIFGDQPGMWLCTRLDGRSSDGGATYRATYEFQRGSELQPKSNTGAPIFMSTPSEPFAAWRSVYQMDGAFLSDPDLVSPNLIPGDGIKVAELYPRADFRQIPGLPFGPLPTP